MTHIGVDNDPEHILMGAVRAALADGWGGSMIATDVSDILFGRPQPLRSRVNLGVLKEDEVNLIVHGHEPTLSDVIVAAVQDPEILAEAKAKGAKGINLAGICCTANEILGGRYRPSFRPLNDGIQAGRLRGVAGVVGCNNPKFPHDKYHLAMVRELIRNDVLVLQTGCSAIACAKAGLLAPEAAEKHAGKGLQEICRAVGMPPVLHVGSCVDNSRILTACRELVKEGGIGDSFDKLPVAGAAPEWMSEKAISIGMYVVASGIFTVVNPALPVQGSRYVEELLTKTFEKYFGATWAFESDPIKAAHLMIDHIDRKRADLGLPTPMYEVPYAPKTVQAATRAS